MKQYTKLVAMILCSLLTSITQAQDIVNLLPPAPNAASLGKYAGINPNLSSGAASFSISLLNYSSKNISFPLSINYTTNGFKVDEIASRVGNQWTLMQEA